MVLLRLNRKIKSLGFSSKYSAQEKDFVKFTKEQFNQIIRKNLSLPMKLYHL